MTSLPGFEVESHQSLRLIVQRSLMWIFIVTLTIVVFLILAFNLVTGPKVSVSLGKPAAEEIVAPQSITFSSSVLTDQAKQQAALSIPNQYTPLDLSIARAQNNTVRSVFGFIDVVRSDPSADLVTKVLYLQSMDGLVLESEVAEDLLALSQAEFVAARDNILRIVEDTMRQGVVEEQLSAAKRKASLGAAFDLTPGQERVVISLAPQFVVPNIFLDAETTTRLQEEAQATVEPVTQIVTQDQQILRVGDIVDEVDIEMLQQLGLLQQKLDWQRAISAGLAALLAVTIITLYWNQYFGYRSDTARSLLIIGILLALFVLTAKILMASKSVYAYLYPAAALSILLAVIFEARLSILVTVVQAGLVGYIAQESLEMTIYAATGGILAVLMLRDAQRINALFRAGLVAALGNVAVILIFRLAAAATTTELMTSILFGAINGPVLSAGISLAGIFIIGSVFRIITPLQLQELSRLDHPLLQELLRRAPGTYHHSIMVANLAEQASEMVGANSPMVRVGAFYHDIGKMNRPPFFSENQDGGNPHDNLDPYSSARIIICHVSDGLELARRYRLPNQIRDFIAEHHGDRVLKSFYHKAMDGAADGEVVDAARFRYSGPRPGSRETGIVQLADSIEATSRALRPSTEGEIERLVTTIVEDHLREGQLDDSGLTLGDVKLLRESFIKTVKGRFHVRVKYPGNDELLGGPKSSDGDRPLLTLETPIPRALESGMPKEVDEPIPN